MTGEQWFILSGSMTCTAVLAWVIRWFWREGFHRCVGVNFCGKCGRRLVSASRVRRWRKCHNQAETAEIVMESEAASERRYQEHIRQLNERIWGDYTNPPHAQITQVNTDSAAPATPDAPAGTRFDQVVSTAIAEGIWRHTFHYRPDVPLTYRDVPWIYRPWPSVVVDEPQRNVLWTNVDL